MMHETITQVAAGPLFTADAQPLFDALDYLARFVALKYETRRYRNSDLPKALTAVRIDADASGLIVLSSCDLDLHCAVTVPGAVDVPGVMAVNAATLRDLIKAAGKAARVTIQSVDIGRAVVTYGRIKQTIGAESDRNLPALRPVGDRALELDAATLAIDVKRLQPFAVEDHRRDGALQVCREPGALELVAGDGNNLAAVTREAPAGDAWRVSLSSRSVEALARALKAWPGGSIDVGQEDNRLTFVGDRFAMTMHVGEAAGWGDWRAQSATVLGGELQRSLMPGDEPRLHPEAMKRFAKAAGAVVVEIGDRAARLSIAGDASWQGVTMLQPEGSVPNGYHYEAGHTQPARAYLGDLMARHGITPAPGEQKIIERNGRVLGMTVGEFRGIRRVRREMVLDWEALVEREIEIVEHEAGWQPGAFSVVMPRVRESVSASMAVEVDDELIPLATNARGSIYMTAAQVAKWCGPVDPSTHVAIAPLPVRKAWWKKTAPALAPVAVTGEAALYLSAAAMLDHADACQAAADAANVVPVAVVEAVEPLQAAPVPVLVAVEHVEAVEAPELPEPAASPSLPVQAGNSAPEMEELRAMVLAMADRLAVLEGRAPGVDAVPVDAAPVEPVAIADAAPARAGRDDVARLKLVRTYLALRQARTALARAAVQHAIGQQQYDDVKARLAATEQAREAAIERLEQVQADARRYAATEQALLDARARGDRMARVAVRQRTGLARAAIDLRGARAETGAVRRQLAQALQPAPAPSSLTGTLANALARAGL